MIFLAKLTAARKVGDPPPVLSHHDICTATARLLDDPPGGEQRIGQQDISRIEMDQQILQETLLPRSFAFAGSDLIVQHRAAGQANQRANPGGRKAQPRLLFTALRVRFLITRRVGH